MRESRLVDAALALCWLPFVAVTWLASDDDTALAVSLTLAASFPHQLLTLPLVYGDPRNFALRRRLFTWAPVALAAAVFTAQHVSLTVLAIVAGLWNMEHTVMQRYGIIRIYGRRAGETEAKLERTMLLSWLVLTVVWIAADPRTGSRIYAAGIRGKSRRGLDILVDLRPPARVILPVVATIAVAATGQWLWRECRRGVSASAPKRFYVASTAALFVTLLVNPIAGLMGFVGAHAAEYFLIVHQSVGQKYASAAHDDGAAVGAAVRRFGPKGSIALFVVGAVACLSLLDRVATPAVSTVVLVTLGGMHVLYDGFIWKRPSPGKGGMFASGRTVGAPA